MENSLRSNMLFRRLEINDAKKISSFYLKNRVHFQPWEPKRSSQYHSLAAWQCRLEDYDKEFKHQSGAHFLAIDQFNDNIIAFCSLTNIIQGPFKACFMGYGVDAEHQGLGITQELCAFVVKFAFEQLNLNRVMANYVPENKRSENLLKRLGFVQEGFAKRYLQINGQWRDHVLTAKLNPRI